MTPSWLPPSLRTTLRTSLRVVATAVALSAMAAPARDVTAQPAPSRTLRIASKLLGETRIAHVLLPVDYEHARRRYPTVLLLDGQVRAFVELTAAATRYDLPGASGDPIVPAQIVVAVEQDDRRRDLATRDTLFARFLVEELLPQVDREYRTVPFRTIVGHSLGGRFALLAPCLARDSFRAVVAISPGVADSATAHRVRDCARAMFARDTGAAVRHVVVAAGEREERLAAPAHALRQFLADSAPRSWRVSDVDGTGLGHTETPLVAIPMGLRRVFMAETWRLPASATDSLARALGEPEEVLRGALAAVSRHAGYAVPATIEWRRMIAGAQLSRGTAAGAVAAAERMIAEFPEDVQGYAFLADAHVRRLDIPAARRALERGLAVLEQVQAFDATGRARTRANLRASLADLTAR